MSDSGEAPQLICSARGCRREAAWALLWNNPRLHAPQRRKTWLACDDHQDTFAGFLNLRGFLRGTVPVAEAGAAPEADAAPEATHLPGPRRDCHPGRRHRGPRAELALDAVRLLRERLWLRSLLLVILFAVACTYLGRWQWLRYVARAAAVHRIEANHNAAPAPLEQLLTTAQGALPDGLIWRPVTVTGSTSPSGRY